MAKLSISFQSETRLYPALARTILGSAKTSSWPLWPPSFSSRPTLVPDEWLEIRWRGPKQGWGYRFAYAMQAGGQETRWRDLADGDVVEEHGVRVQLIGAGPPVPVAVNTKTEEFIDTTEGLYSIAEYSRGEWFDLEGAGPLGPGETIRAMGSYWRFYPAKPPKPTHDRGPDCGSPAMRLTLDLSGRRPLLVVETGKYRAVALGKPVLQVAAYVYARAADEPTGGWLTRDVFAERCAVFLRKTIAEIRKNLSNEARSNVIGQLQRDKARRTRTLFQLSDGAVRLRCEPEQIRIIPGETP